MELQYEPATAERWEDLVEVFGKRGGHEGCWCLYWRIKRAEMGRLGVAGRRRALRRLTAGDEPPGILYYDATRGQAAEPIGWCSLGPREGFTVLARSPVLKPVDDRPTWSIVCFLLREPYRSQGLFRDLLRLAIDHARSRRAPRIEAYPRERHRSGVWAYMGHAHIYQEFGFRELARRKPDRPILRLEL